MIIDIIVHQIFSQPMEESMVGAPSFVSTTSPKHRRLEGPKLYKVIIKSNAKNTRGKPTIPNIDSFFSFFKWFILSRARDVV